MSYQKGVIRTNCLDCLDRTNVFQTKVLLCMIEDKLGSDVLQDRALALLNNMWGLLGDCISKIYAGTASVLTSVTLKGKENVLDTIHHGITTMKRFIKQNLSDDFKQECISVLQGVHPLCNTIPGNMIESVVLQ